MKITLDLTSVVVGGAAALVLGLVAGFSPQATQLPSQQQAQASAVSSQAWPEAEDIVVLTSRGDDWGGSIQPFCIGGTGRDSAVFTVPPGRVLIVSSLTRSSGIAGSVQFAIDGLITEQSFSSSTDFGVGLLVLAEGQTLQLLAPPCPPSGGGTSPIAGAFYNLHCYLEDA